MNKVTRVDLIEITRSGAIQVRLKKLIVDDDGTELDLGYHRTVFEPGTDIESQITAVNAQLVQLKAAAVDAVEFDVLRAVAPVVQTPEKIAEFQAALQKV